MTRRYIGNLPFSANEEFVRALFAEFGTVQSFFLSRNCVIGTPRGFGFVEMSSGDSTCCG